MLPDLATDLSTTLAVASMLFFVVVYFVVVARLFAAGRDEMDARARLALDDAAEAPPRVDGAVHG